MDIQDMTDDQLGDVHAFFYDDFAWETGDERSHDAMRVCDAERAFRRWTNTHYYDKDLQSHFRRALTGQKHPLMAFHMVVKKHLATGVYVIEDIQVYDK